MTKTVVGLYDDFARADRVVRALLDAGFDRNDISLIAQDATHGNQPPLQSEEAAHADGVGDGIATGAGTGAVLGGIAGLLVGLGALAIPGFGPLLAAGPLAAVLAGAGAGAVAGGLIGALVDAGVPEEQARSYAEGVHRGGTLVTLRAPEGRAGEAAEIMNRFDPIDMPERAREPREASHEEDAREGLTPAARPRGNLGEQDTGRRDRSTHDRDVAGAGTPALDETELGGSSQRGEGRQARLDTGVTSGEGDAAEIGAQPTSQAGPAPQAQAGGTAGPMAANTRGGITGDQGAGSMRTDAQGADRMPDSGSEDMPREAGKGQGASHAEGDFTGIGHGEWETRDLQEIVSHDATEDMGHGGGMDRGAQVSGSQGTHISSGQQGSEDMEHHPGRMAGHDMDMSWGQESRGMPDEQALGTDTSGSSGISNQDWRSREMGAGGPGSAGGEGAWQSGSSQGGTGHDYGSFEGDFRRHHEMVFGSSGRAFDEWEPGYRYGYDLAQNPQFRGRKWSEIEPAAQHEWESSHPGYAWDEFRAAIRHGWERVTASMREQGPDVGNETGWQAGSSQGYGSQASHDTSPGVEGDWDRR